ncbi:hypothetical protein CSKR_200571 [Clonorchis sinensis]|uniref:Uncharacterized protein n=1 Tax=Clonorchis sinensis TaxID=79923 RepID=A0A8T1MFI3_CLOSI|nr:hypothetical protein CSKR_200571 [Clonorchis sinensis]
MDESPLKLNCRRSLHISIPSPEGLVGETYEQICLGSRIHSDQMMGEGLPLFYRVGFLPTITTETIRPFVYSYTTWACRHQGLVLKLDIRNSTEGKKTSKYIKRKPPLKH